MQDTAAKKFNPSNYRTNWIEPESIYGVTEGIQRSLDTGNPVCILDHPEFPNPRVSMDKELVEEIKESDSLERPVDLFFTKDGDAVIVDGKTRVTAVAQYLADCKRNGIEPVKFKRIEYTRQVGTEHSIRFLAVKLNIRDNYRPLSEIEIALAIQRYKKAGFTDEQIAEAFNKAGRPGKQFVCKYLDIYSANPKVIEDFEAGKIDTHTAVAISRHVAFDKQAEVSSKASSSTDKPSKVTRRELGLRKGSRTTISFAGTMSAVEEILPDFIVILKKMEDGKFTDLKSALHLDESGMADYLGECAILEQMRVWCKVLKIDDRTVKDQLTFLIENCSEETSNSLPNVKFSRDSAVMKSTVW